MENFADNTTSVVAAFFTATAAACLLFIFDMSPKDLLMTFTVLTAVIGLGKFGVTSLRKAYAIKNILTGSLVGSALGDGMAIVAIAVNAFLL